MNYQDNPTSLIWSAETRAAVDAGRNASLGATYDLIRRAYATLDGADDVSAASLMQAYLEGAGADADGERAHLSFLIDDIARRQSIIGPSERLFHHPWRPRREWVERLCPDFVRLLFEDRDNTMLESIQLLDPSPNNLFDPEFPASLTRTLHFERRPGLIAYQTDDAVVYIHPFHYQILNANQSASWISGSPRFFSRACIPTLPVEVIDRDIIVAQDRFDFSNLAHFLFDGVTRVLHYSAQIGISGKELFIFGGIPKEYQVLICDTLADYLGLDHSNFLFTQTPRLVRGRRTTWFSDQVDVPLHPAQWANPHSVTALTKFCGTIPAPECSDRRVYVSRADAKSRRIINEKELLSRLSERGFVSVSLADMSPEQQIGIFRGAEIIVAPHGQGLSHLPMSSRIGRVIELFNPTSGTDCYAWMSKGLGIDYRFVSGDPAPNTPGDFAIDIDRILALVDGPAPARRSTGGAGNLIRASRSFAGFQPSAGAEFGLADVQMIWGQQSAFHRSGSNGDEAGRWPAIEVSPGCRYTVSCWVFVPPGKETVQVRLSLLGCAEPLTHTTQEETRGQWCRVWTTAVATVRVAEAALLIDSPNYEGTIMTTCWQLERGFGPAAYVATL